MLLVAQSAWARRTPRFHYDVAMTLRPVTIIGMVVSMLGGVSLGVAAFWSAVYYEDDAKRERLVVSAVREIRNSYFSEVDADVLVDNAISGMIDGLDGHSAFLDGEALLVLHEETSGRFGGIGIEVRMVDDYVTVISSMARAPAERAGIASGDRLIEVDHRSLKGLTLSQAVQKLRGEPGTDVHLRVIRQSDAAPLDFDITRESIASVSSRMLAPGVGYVRIYRFDRPTHADLENVIGELQRQGSLDGLVLDLRSNPGGLLATAVDVADAFLGDGVIVTIDGRQEHSQRRFHATAGDIVDGTPLAVLIDGQSASAAEVVAGALKDRRRAVVVGSGSFGKGSVQSVIRLGSRALKLTTAHYVTPNGYSIQDGGVMPDRLVTRQQGESKQAYDRRLFEAALTELRKTKTGYPSGKGCGPADAGTPSAAGKPPRSLAR